MGPHVDRSVLHRVVGAFAALVSVGLLALVATAAIQPRVDNPHGKFKGDCQMCHNAKGWKIVKISPKFDHGKFGFSLAGAHAAAACTGCHTSLDFAQSKTQCVSCHQDPHRGEMGVNCAHCHGARSFQDRGPMVRAHQLSQFPLSGSHATVDCEGCHKPAAQGKMQFVGTSVECYSCHKAQYETAPGHKSGNYSTQCQTCHTPTAWGNVSAFDHGAVGFALTGGHVTACDNCHHGVFTSISKDCYSCHATTYAGATPTHNPTAFPTATANCTGCHQAAAANHVTWAGATNYDHTAAGFPLTGNHSTTVRQCDDCHHGNYTTMSKDCASCHTTTSPGYNNPGPGAPVHTATYFPPAQCASCHTAAAASHTSWAGAVYTHQQMQLTNAHAGHLCEDCHKGNYTNLAFSCYGCHQNSTPGYATATAPTHTPTSFPTSNAACTGCHNTVAWRPASFTHPATFPLSNAHAGHLCEDCHAGNYTTLVNNCYGCHQNSTPGYATATNPTHTPAGFPTTNSACTGCHNTIAWRPASFTHTATFPLTNAHAGHLCEDCHKGNYTSLVNNCYGCHQNSTPGYATATNPTHTPAGFPTTNSACTGCHNTIAWRPASFTHTATFPLTNAHAGRLCEDCHNGNYTSLVNNCYTCHQNSVPGYANATNPPHSPTAFPTTNAACTGCHNTVAFQPSTFNHSSTPFPLTGAHLAVACTGCHNASTWSVLGTGTNCYGCHATDYATATPPHTPAAYPQAGCACHTTTTWLGATAFDHASVGFSMTGNHSLAARQCTDCHNIIGYTRQTTDFDCITCHATAYNSNGVLIHQAPNFPSTTAQCIACHAAANTSHVTWNNGVFTNHAGVTTSFALSGNHGGRQCDDCHTAATTDLKQYTCAQSCHTSRLNGHPNASCNGGFAAAKTDPAIKTCYKCHPRGTSSTGGGC